MPFSVSLPFSSIAPSAFITISEGTISGRAWPMVFSSGLCGGGGGAAWSWATASAGVRARAITLAMRRTEDLILGKLPYWGLQKVWRPAPGRRTRQGHDRGAAGLAGLAGGHA